MRADFAALSGMGSFEITRGNLSRSRELARGMPAARRSPDVETALHHGTPAPRRHAVSRRPLHDGAVALEKAIHLYEEDRSSRKGKQVMYVQDQKATGLCYLGLGPDDHGTPRRWSGGRQGRRAARRALGAMHALNFSLCYLAGVHHFRREAAEALQCATESLELSRELGFASWRGASQMVRGEA